MIPVANLFAEIRALTRDGVMPSQLISTLQHRLEETRDVLQGSTVVAMGLLSAARGERRHARELLESVRWFDPRAIAPGTMECALGWLVTDAAAEGEWRRVRTLLPEAPDTAAMRFFGHLASRALGDTTVLPSDDWYQLPAEARTFSEKFTGKTTPREALTELAEPVGSVLQQLLAVNSDTSAAVLAQVSGAVSALLKSPQLRDRLMERSTMLGGGSPDEALSDLRAICEDVLGDALTKLEGEEPLLREIAARRRSGLIEELHERLDRLTDACEDGSAPPMTEVWREFVAIRHCYARAVALSEPSERGWPHHVALRLTRYLGTWLRLTKRQRPFAHAVFLFLEAEAQRAGDESAASLARASAELCLPFQLHSIPTT